MYFHCSALIIVKEPDMWTKRDTTTLKLAELAVNNFRKKNISKNEEFILQLYLFTFEIYTYYILPLQMYSMQLYFPTRRGI